MSRGSLIGFSALVVFGRPIGMMGILVSTLDFDFGKGSSRPFFLLGLVLTSLILSLVAP